MAELQTFYMEKGHLGRAPADLYVFELFWEIRGLTPDQIRQISPRDLAWIRKQPEAWRLAVEEMERRKAERGATSGASESRRP